MTFKPALVLLFIAATPLFAQKKTTKITTANGRETEFQISTTSEHPVKNQIIFDRPTTQNTSNQSVERRLIVRLKGDALAKENKSDARSRTRLLEQDHFQFIDEFKKLHQSSAGSKTNAPTGKIHFEYKNTFNGFSVTTTIENEKKLKSLPYVASVTEDKKIETIDLTGHEIIGADKVWSQYNITGKGVVIGIIDTGIDYNHPDLGNGMGPNKKVIGGYDFVNNDNDPFDDHGHGTHVAGIAAANGTIKGVAPDAKLMAFKVLTSGGWGYDSWILAGIERTVDPDQNPNTDDAVDVVNMSVGRPSDPNEPYSEAIANATSMGVIFVVAAGNNYLYQSVGTPGVAPAAITVAATDQADVTADFSSKGPTEDFRIKPDMAAPGVGIYSTFPGGQYQTWSGTSMATPHVAGAVALLLEKHPNWTSETVKAVLMNTAKKSTESLWHQGAGRIDLEKAINPDFEVSPGSISLGLTTASEGPQVKVATASVRNFSTQTRIFSFSVTGGIQKPGIAINIEPKEVILQPGESSSVTLTFQISPSLETMSFKEGYFGEFVVTSQGSSVASPIALVNAKQTTLYFSEPLPTSVSIVGEDVFDFYKFLVPTTTEVKITLPDRPCEIVTYYDYRHIVVQDSVHNASSVSLVAALAKNAVVFNYKDIDSNPISIDKFTHVGSMLFSTRRHIGFYFFPLDTIYISDSKQAMVDMIFRDNVNNNFYDISKGTGQGIHESQILSNDFPFSKVVYHSDNNAPQSLQFMSTGFHLGKGGLALWNYSAIPFVDNFTVYSSQRSVKENFVYSKILLKPQNESVRAIETGFVAPLENDILSFNELGAKFWNSFANYAARDFDYTVGGTLLRWNGKMSNSANQLTLFDWPLSYGLFNYTLGDKIRGEVQYELKANNQVVKSGTVLNRTHFDYYQSYSNELLIEPVTPQVHSLRFTFNDHRVLGQQGYAQADLEFNPSAADKNPPSLDFFSMESNARSINNIWQDEPAVIKLSLSDDCYSCKISSSIAIRKAGETQWTGLPLLNLGGNSLQTDVPLDLTVGFYDLKVIASDPSGNKLTYELSPAFYVDTPGSNAAERVTLLEPGNHQQQVERSPVFYWEPKQDAVSYTFQLSQYSTFSSLVHETTINSTDFLFYDNLNYFESYYWRVRANYASGSGPWSFISDFKTRGVDEVVTAVPEDTGSQLKAYAYPNPFDQQTTIAFYMERSGEVQFEITDTKGKVISTFSQSFQSGINAIQWQGDGAPRGLYICRIISASGAQTVKVARKN